MTHPKLLIDSHFYGMVVGNSSVDAVVLRLVLEGFHASHFLCRLGYRYHQLASSCLLDNAVLYRRHFAHLNSCFDIINFHSIQCKASFDAFRSAALLISSYSPNVDKIHDLLYCL